MNSSWSYNRAQLKQAPSANVEWCRWKKVVSLLCAMKGSLLRGAEQSANLPAVTADAIWSTGEKPKSKNSFYGNEIFLTYNRYAPFQRSTFVFQANAKTEPAIIDLDRVMWGLLKNSVELRLALKKIRKMGDDWGMWWLFHGEEACSLPPRAVHLRKVMNQTAQMTRNDMKLNVKIVGWVCGA